MVPRTMMLNSSLNTQNVYSRRFHTPGMVCGQVQLYHLDILLHCICGIFSIWLYVFIVIWSNIVFVAVICEKCTLLGFVLNEVCFHFRGYNSDMDGGSSRGRGGPMRGRGRGRGGPGRHGDTRFNAGNAIPDYINSVEGKKGQGPSTSRGRGSNGRVGRGSGDRGRGSKGGGGGGGMDKDRKWWHLTHCQFWTDPPGHKIATDLCLKL